MRRTREKVVATVVDNVVVLLEQGDVAGLGNGIAAEINGSKDSAGVGAVKFGDVALHFADSVGVDFHQCDVTAANSQADSADASVEVES